MTSYELWKFLHIVAAIVWIGGAFVAQVLGVLAKRSGDPARSAAFGRDLAFVGVWIFLPSSLVVLVTGVLLTTDGNWDWSEPFIAFGLVGWAVVWLTAFGYLMREMGKVGVQMAAEGPNPALLARVNRLVLLGRAIIVVLVAIEFMMVAKLGT